MYKKATVLLKIILGIVIVLGAVTDDYFDENQLEGCLWFFSGYLSFTTLMFIMVILPVKEYRKEDRAMRISYNIGRLSLLSAYLTLPIWSLMTGQFPPDDFTGIGAIIATIMIIGPIAGIFSPSIVGLSRIEKVSKDK